MWQEIKSKRTLTGKHFHNSETGQSHYETISGLRLHYANNAAEVDFEPEYVEAGNFKGYRVVRNEWHYAIGSLNGDAGWAGMGLRNGKNWLRFKLARVGYFHQPTKDFEFIGGLPNYDMNNLAIETDSVNIGPPGVEITLKPQTNLVWSDVFNGVYIRWRVNGKRLKEEIVVSEATRNVLPTPSTPLNETWLTMIFEIDAGGIGKWLKNNIEQDPDNTDDSDGPLYLRDNLDRYLGFLPIDYAYTQDGDGETNGRVRLTKRIFKKNGTHYLVVGAKVAELNNLPAGAIIFDPTYETQPDEADAKDTFITSANPNDNNGTGSELVIRNPSTPRNALIEFDLSSIPSDATCDSATLSLWEADSVTSNIDVYSLALGVEDWEELQATWNDYKTSTNWPGAAGATLSGTDYESSSMGLIVKAGPVDAETSTALTALRVEGWFGATNTNYGMTFGQSVTSISATRFHSSNNGTAAFNPKLSVTYTEAVTPVPPTPGTFVESIGVSTLIITDGTIFVDLVADTLGFHLCNWDRVLATWKGGGVWRNPVLGEGRQLQFAKYANVLETFTLKANASSQDAMIQQEQDLIRLLNQAVDYWLRDDITIDPVYLEAKAAQETNVRYALIQDFRVPQMGNQFEAPYLQPGCLSAMDDFDLIVERGHWLALPPGTDDEVSVSHLQNVVLEQSFNPAQNSDTASTNGGAIVFTVDVRMGASNGPYDDYNLGVRFNSVSIPQEASILSAFIEMSEGAINDEYCSVIIAGENADDANTFSTFADFEGRERTTANLVWDVPSFDNTGVTNTPDIKDIIQEIVDRAGWASGNDLVVFFDNNNTPGGLTRKTDSYTTVGASSFTLNVKYTNGTMTGQEKSASAISYAANKTNAGNITHIYHYDTSSATFSSNLIDASLPYDLYPVSPASGDYLYIGVSDDNGAIESGFFSLVFNVLDGPKDVEVQIYSASGGGWITLALEDNGNLFYPNRNNTGGAVMTYSTSTEIEMFENAGVGSFHFLPELQVSGDSWSKVTINGVSAYWVRFESQGTEQVSQSIRQIYTVVNNSIDIASDIIDGDIRAIMRGVFEQQSGIPDNTFGNYMDTNRFIFGARELLPTDYFTSFINCTDYQNGVGVVITLGDDTAETTGEPLTANTEYATFTATDTVQSSRVSIDIAEFAAQSYYGTFRVFFRGYQSNKAGADFAKVNIQVETGSGGVTYTGNQVAFEYENDWQLLELGTIRIPTSSLFTSSEISDTIILNLQIQAGTIADVVRCYDICLIPTYDYSGDFIDKANTDDSRIGFRREVIIDSTTQPKADIRAVVANTETDKLTGVLQSITSGKFTLKPRKNLRLYFLFARYGDNNEWVSEPWICHSVQLFKNQRYLSARGAD